MSEVEKVNLALIYPNPYQPEGRLKFTREIICRMAASIREYGLLQTPVVRMKGQLYEIGDGWLRFLGFRWLVENEGLTEYSELPVIVRELTDRQMADMVIEANTVRRDINPIDLARLYVKYLADFDISQAELARLHNCSQGAIANTIRLLDLPEDTQSKIISQEISESHGRQLLRLNYNTELQQKVLSRVIEDGYSVNHLSNQIQSEIYRDSKNLDPDDYPKPMFDVTECEKCPSRQKIGSPYSNSTDKKTWRCLDSACYKKKTDQAEKERADKLAAEIAAAKKEAGDKKKDAGILDLSKLTWRDYQELDSSIHKIDKTECKNCSRRALSKMWNGRTETVCVDVKCFKAKEKAHQDKEAAKVREAERQLTERVKAACVNLKDESTPFELIVGYLLGHCRKDTREKFGRMYELKVDNIAQWFAVNIPADEPEVIQRTAALVLTLERYEGEKGVFQKMLADLEGTSAELDKALADHRAKHCKGCIQDDGNCRQLLKRHGEGWNDKCYHYSKKEEAEKEDEGLAEAEEATANPTEEEIDADSAQAEAHSTGEQELLSFQFKYCDGCHWADQARVGTGYPCCTFITTPHIVDGECRTRKVRESASDNASDNKDPLAQLVIHSATDGEKEHLFKLGETEIRGKTLRGCVLALGKHMGWGSTTSDVLDALDDMESSPNVELLVSILEGEQ